jgi:uncharacterized protein (DUF2336 family)
MASQPFTDGIMRLAHAGDDTRIRTLLKAATELFVAEDRHVRAEIAMFEELALQLLRSTPLADRRAVAGLLARHPDAPPAVLRALMQDEIAVAEVVLAECDGLGDMELLAVIATGTDDHLEAVAARPHLSAVVVEALVRNMPASRLPTLIANATIRFSEPLVAHLAARGREDPVVARALARRHDDVEDTDLTDLFLDLDDKGRRRVVQALEILALREFAAKKPMPRTPTPDPAKVQELARAALSRDVDLVAGHLAELLRLDHATAARLLVDKTGEPLAIALRAAGLDGPTAVRVILFSGGEDVRNYFEVKRLVDLYETVSLRAAMLLVGRWRAEAEPLPLRRRHLPQTEAGTPVRGVAAGQPVRQPADATVVPPRRERA